ncbi:hypothetical protein [Flavobacterium sp. ov086]|uniref:hypothetical protein n=1 Tax=Flavobacterium sp. ov086 TaxID=1761785 RepID=UPI000B6C1B28|nr:hypothetical protein [Flavobacterium sp. ov086]SNR80621.1 hypothetical protein SAMN04487979_12268 [Flavobacterium sp. ov086]
MIHAILLYKVFKHTEMGDDQDLRIKMVSLIRTRKMLANALGPFSDTEINNACKKIMNA